MADATLIPGVVIKAGACVIGMEPRMVRACIVIGKVYAQFGPYTCVLTSGVDGTHSLVSLHYRGRAADFRFWNVPEARRPALRDALKAALGKDFDVVLEKDHIHVELDPK
jgi:hypothetical protein